jgi:hypothetical protein
MDLEILKRIEEIAQEDWWAQGLDAPEEVVWELENFETEVSSLSHLIEATMSGPDSTDVWLPRNLLIGDVIGGREDLDRIPSEEEIHNDNMEFFAEIRARLLSLCQLELYGEGE